jgi:hypothetical protein
MGDSSDERQNDQTSISNNDRDFSIHPYVKTGSGSHPTFYIGNAGKVVRA